METRTAIFAKLGAPVPSTMALYKKFIASTTESGLLGMYEAAFVFLELRENAPKAL
jgi:hypothetical protein